MQARFLARFPDLRRPRSTISPAPGGMHNLNVPRPSFASFSRESLITMLVRPRELQTALSIHTFQLPCSVASPPRNTGRSLKSFGPNCALSVKTSDDSREIKSIPNKAAICFLPVPREELLTLHEMRRAELSRGGIPDARFSN